MIQNYLDYLKSKEKASDGDDKEFKEKTYFDIDKDFYSKIPPEHSTKIMNIKGVYNLQVGNNLPIEIDDIMIDYFGVVYQK